MPLTPDTVHLLPLPGINNSWHQPITVHRYGIWAGDVWCGLLLPGVVRVRGWALDVIACGLGMLLVRVRGWALDVIACGLGMLLVRVRGWARDVIACGLGMLACSLCCCAVPFGITS
jgi:hypothetical protein